MDGKFAKFLVVLILEVVYLKTLNAADYEIDSCTNFTCSLTWGHLRKDSQGKQTCECASSIFDEQPWCSSNIDVIVQSKYCMTFDKLWNVTYIGDCPYNSLLFHQYKSDNIRLPRKGLELTNFMCNVSNFTREPYFCGQQRRQGLLCGSCENGLGPAVNSYTYHCVECKWYGWLLYLTVCFIPATGLCLFIIVFRINVLSPPLNAVILLYQVMSSHVNHMPCRFLFYATKNQVPPESIMLLLTLYGFTNMDFFVYVVPPFCISNTMSTLTVIALDYTVALYPLLLSAVIYMLIEIHDRGNVLLRWMWWPFHICLARLRQSWDVKGSVINAFATLYVLSFTKVISTSSKLWLTTVIGNVCDHQNTSNLYYNASCSLLEPCHRPHAILALAVATLFIIIPSMFIFLHSFKVLHKCFKCHKFKLANELTKIFHRSFKDGTDESIDCRWFAGIYLLLKMLLATSVNWKSKQQIQVISSITGVLLVALFQPHTHTVNNIIDSFLFGGLAITFVLLPAGNSHHVSQVLLFFLPLLVMCLLILCKLLLKYKNHIKDITLTCLNRIRRLCYFHRLRSSIESSNSFVARENEQLIDQNEAKVLYTVVDISD